MNGNMHLVLREHILVVIFSWRRHSKSGALYLSIVTNPHPPSATVGYTDSSSDIISNNAPSTVKLVLCRKKLRKR
jgi:hypothetical protein